MKIKKRQFARLKDIAESVSQVMTGTGIKLDKLIADIESIQKQKEEFSLIDIDQLRKGMAKQKVETIQEKPISPSELVIKIACDKHRKSVDDNIENKYGWDKNPLSVDSKRVKVVDLEEPTSTSGFVGNIEFTGNIFNDSIRQEFAKSYIRQGESMVAASTDKNTEFKGGLRDAVEALSDPRIGDEGYFNLGNPNAPVVYGRMRNFTGNNYQDTHGNWYRGFSKTPPELR